MTLGLWQQPATPLPFWVRPVRGETTMSYVFRLATANELVRPTTLLRSIGQPSNVQPHQFMLRDGFEVKLNTPHSSGWPSSPESHCSGWPDACHCRRSSMAPTTTAHHGWQSSGQVRKPAVTARCA